MANVKIDLKDAKEKWTDALERLRKEQQPGEVVGKGGLKTGLDMMVAEFTALLNDGYTPLQIAEALTKTDVAKILPKHVTEVLNRSKKYALDSTTEKRKRNRKTGTAEQKVKSQPIATEVKEDLKLD